MSTRTSNKHAPTPPPALQAEASLPKYDAKAGAKAFASLAARRAALSADAFSSTATDLAAATGAALGVASFVAEATVHARFAGLPKEELNPEYLSLLVPASFAVLYALGEAEAAGALETDAKLPADLVARAVGIEARMQKLCEYHFADDPEVAPLLAFLSPGTGHWDLAGDLRGYARIYNLRADLVAADSRYYVPTDRADAEAISAEMLTRLGDAQTPAARAAAADLARAWTVLVAVYGEVAVTGQWLFRHEPEASARFVSLYTAGRRPPPRRKKVKDGQPAPANGGVAP